MNQCNVPVPADRLDFPGVPIDVQRDPEIATCMCRANGYVSDLHAVLDDLEKRLTPIRNCPPEAASGQVPPPTDAATQLGQSIEGFSGRIRLAVERILYVNRTLEI